MNSKFNSEKFLELADRLAIVAEGAPEQFGIDVIRSIEALEVAKHILKAKYAANHTATI